MVQCGGPGNGGKFVMWVRGTGYGNTPQLLGVLTAGVTNSLHRLRVFFGELEDTGCPPETEAVFSPGPGASYLTYADVYAVCTI